MRLIISKDYQELSKRTAEIIASQVRVHQRTVLGLATGSTPVGAYQELVRLYREEALDFSNVDTFNLDEYVGLEDSHPQSYRFFMDDNFLDHINVNPERTHVPNGMATNLDEECRQYDQMIDACGGIDLQLLGMGNNGHIGFNEPGPAFIAQTNVVQLTKSTISANSRFFHNEEEVPRSAITMGFRPIMQARQIIFVVSGKAKAEVVRQALQGPVVPSVPASILQLHGDLIVVLDEDAASALDRDLLISQGHCIKV